MRWLEEVDEMLSSCPGGSEVYLHVIMPDFSRKARRSRRYRVAEDSAVADTAAAPLPGPARVLGKGGLVTTSLEFEKPVLELEQRIQELKTRAAESGLDAVAELAELERKADDLRREIYAGLTPFQRVQLAKHPEAPVQPRLHPGLLHRLDRARRRPPLRRRPGDADGARAARGAPGHDRGAAEGARHARRTCTAASACRTPRATARRSA